MFPRRNLLDIDFEYYYTICRFDFKYAEKMYIVREIIPKERHVRQNDISGIQGDRKEKRVNDDNCPIRRLLSIFSGKWSMRVIFELTKEDHLRFGGLKKQIPEITNTMLSSTLKDLENMGLVVRTQLNEIPPHVEYALSEKGKSLYPIFLEMAYWAENNI